MTQPIARVRGRRLQAIRSRLLRAEPLCAECRRQGRLREAVALDHVVALVNGGTNDEANLQGLCRECHREKTAADTGKRARIAVGADGYPLHDAPTSAPAGDAGQILGANCRKQIGRAHV